MEFHKGQDGTLYRLKLDAQLGTVLEPVSTRDACEYMLRVSKHLAQRVETSAGRVDICGGYARALRLAVACSLDLWTASHYPFTASHETLAQTLEILRREVAP